MSEIPMKDIVAWLRCVRMGGHDFRERQGSTDAAVCTRCGAPRDGKSILDVIGEMKPERKP